MWSATKELVQFKKHLWHGGIPEGMRKDIFDHGHEHASSAAKQATKRKGSVIDNGSNAKELVFWL